MTDAVNDIMNDAGDNAARNKVVVITGGSDGIGFVSAEVMAAKGAHVILVGQNRDKCAETVATIKNATGNPAVSFEVADLSTLSEVRDLAARLLESQATIDVLMNNAGGFFRERQQTEDGLEYTFALNHMAYFVLTDLLLARLKQAEQGRIINVASRVHQNGKVNFDDLQGRANYAGWPAYCQSKLMNVMFTYALARRLGGTAVTANSLHPGFVASKFGHNNKGMVGLGMRVAQALMAISPQSGAKTQVHLATDPALVATTGGYFVKSRAVDSSAASLDVEVQERLWMVSEELAASIP